MKPPVLALAGKIASGKTTISQYLANTLDYPWVGFGAYVRAEAQRHGLNDSRTSLQQLGATLLERDMELFCKAVLRDAGWMPGQPIVIDGVRHAEVIRVLRNLVAPQCLVVVLVDVPEIVRAQRLIERGVSLAEQHQQEIHSTEVQTHTLLPALADILVDGMQSLQVITEIVIAELQRRGFLLSQANST
jgi:dephospho-CoA kinase